MGSDRGVSGTGGLEGWEGGKVFQEHWSSRSGCLEGPGHLRKPTDLALLMVLGGGLSPGA